MTQEDLAFAIAATLTFLAALVIGRALAQVISELLTL